MSPQYTLFTSLVLLTGCVGNIIDPEGEYELPVFVLELNPCIGGDSPTFQSISCRSQLQQFSRHYQGQVGGCLLVEQEGSLTQTASFKWGSGGGVTLSRSDIILTPEEPFNTHLYYLMGDHTERLNCDDYRDTTSLPCGSISGCMLKLSSQPQVYSSKVVRVSYQGEAGACNSSHVPEYFIEEVRDRLDNDCDSRVDE